MFSKEEKKKSFFRTKADVQNVEKGNLVKGNILKKKKSECQQIRNFKTRSPLRFQIKSPSVSQIHAVSFRYPVTPTPEASEL